jgi:hypothetical protein
MKSTIIIIAILASVLIGSWLYSKKNTATVTNTEDSDPEDTKDASVPVPQTACYKSIPPLIPRYTDMSELDMQIAKLIIPKGPKCSKISGVDCEPSSLDRSRILAFFKQVDVQPSVASVTYFGVDKIQAYLASENGRLTHDFVSIGTLRCENVTNNFRIR